MMCDMVVFGPTPVEDPEADWDIWRRKVEDVLGSAVTDGPMVDMLYDLYLVDEAPDVAAVVCAWGSRGQ